MANPQQTYPQIVTLERPEHHYVLLVAANGSMLGLDVNGDPASFDEASDRVIWDRSASGVRHATTGRDLRVDIDDGTCTLRMGADDMRFQVSHGPERLPSEYLEDLRRDGWVCINSILPPDIVERLERVACTGRYEHHEQRNDMPKICQDAAVGKAVAEPVSLWVLRAFLQTRDIHLGHPPGFNVLPPDTVAQAGRRWHSDIPYTPSSSPQPVFPRKGPPKACNRNTFVSDFSHLNGATMFTPGSHLVDSGPPEEWNAPLENGELPYSGPEATVLEAPSGSMILYDARTWHRAGYNRTGHKRGMMATNYATPDVVPKRDTRPACERLRQAPVYQELNLREQRDVTDLLMKVPDFRARQYRLDRPRFTGLSRERLRFY